MPQRLKKTKAHRALKKKSMGSDAKRARENHGTTPSVPLSGAPLPTLVRGKIVSSEKVKIPAHLLS